MKRSPVLISLILLLALFATSCVGDAPGPEQEMDADALASRDVGISLRLGRGGDGQGAIVGDLVVAVAGPDAVGRGARAGTGGSRGIAGRASR